MENMDDLEIDNLLENNNLFTPITDGLGFHHSIKEEKDLNISLKQKSLDLKSDLENRAKVLNTTITTNTPNPFESNPHSMGELSAFYAKPEKQAVDLKLDLSEGTKNHFEQAHLSLRFGAWVVDSVLIVSMLAMALIAAVFTSEIPLSFFRENILNLDIGFFAFTIVSLFYVFYFSFFDKTQFSTPGKRVFGLKVSDISGKNITLVQALNRTLICSLSLLSMGLGCILKLQDKLTDTQVIKK